ncbi:MAG: PAS domain S-box protein [Hormoscilla sp. GM7CHS1pb]|nr:PAS domain S-box protein [Hormoscilla sp. GM7CHS1pb]
MTLKYPELHNPFLESLVAHAPAVIYQYVLHANGREEFVYVSDYVREIFELEPGAIELHPELIWKRVHPDDRQSCRSAMTAAARSRQPLHWEGRILTPKAGLKWIQITAKPQKQPNRDIVCYGLITDITERCAKNRKQAAAGQMESEQRFRAMFEQADVGIVEYTLDGRVQQVNQKFCDLVGYSQSELLALSYTDITHSDDRAANDAYLRQLFAGEIQTYSIEKRYLRKGATGEQEVTWVHLRVSLVRRSTGEPQSLLAVVTDISARKKAARALKESERRFRAIFNSAFGFITILSPQGKIEQANQTVLDFAGVQLADMVNCPLWETPWWKASRQHQKRLQQAIATAAAGEFVRYEAEILGTDEKIATIDFSLKPVFDSCGLVVLLIAEGRDITERKRAEEARRRSGELLKKKNEQLSETLADLKRTQLQLIQAEKMSSIGQMVAGVAHEINNPVNFIYGNLTHAEDYIKDLLEIIRLYDRHYPQPHPEIAAEIEEMELDFVTEDLPNLLNSMKVGADRAAWRSHKDSRDCQIPVDFLSSG